MTLSTDTDAMRPDNRVVVLIKSQRTNNRFYVLVDPDRGIHNADIVPEIPKDLVLGIAYPCLEDGLNDFAVIRTTFETLEYFPNDADMRSELMEIVAEARGNLMRRLIELRDDIAEGRAHFLGSDLDDFKSYALDIVYRGYPRRNLDSMMKLNVFGAVAEHDQLQHSAEPLYHFEFRDPNSVAALAQEPAHIFVGALFGDVLAAVQDDANYASRYTFDRNVFQKFIALMFVNYATTDPIFYGTNKADYGVSGDKDMARTPLYMAVAREVRSIEGRARLELAASRGFATTPTVSERAGAIEERLVQLPGTLFDESLLLRPLASVCGLTRRLAARPDPETAEMARLLASEMSHLVRELRDAGVLSPGSPDPFTEPPEG